MDLYTQLQALIPCLIAGLCSFILGWERQRREKAAGIRTHLMVCLGSCLFTLASFWFSQYAIDNTPYPVSADPARLAAQIVSGIGFLGGGVILREHNKVQGLTTASTIWVSASIGVLCGAKLYLLAIGATLLALLFLYLGRVASHMLRATIYNWCIELTILENPQGISLAELKSEIIEDLEKKKSLKIFHSYSDSTGYMKFIVNFSGSTSILSSTIKQALHPSLHYNLQIETSLRSEFNEDFYEE